MKKNRPLIAAVCVLILLCGVLVAEAALTLTETNDTAATVFYSWSGSPKTTDNVIQTFQATADGEITSIQAYIEDDEGDTGTSVIYLYGTWDTEIAARSGCVGGTWLGRFDAASMPSEKTLITYSPNGGDRVVTSTKYYCLQFKQSGSGYDGQQWVYGSTSNDYGEGMATTTAVFENPPDQMNGVVDLALIINGQASQHTDEVALVYPVSQSGINFDFSNWNVSFDTATSTTATSTDFYTIQIYSGATSTAITDLSGGAVVYQSESPRNIENNRLFGVNTTYYTDLELRYFKNIYQTYGDLVATSSITSFITGSESETDLGYYPAPTSTATSSEWTFTCDPESGFFVNSLCNLFRFLFVPTPASIERFSEIGDLVAEKPPFGYWNEIKGEIQNISTSTASFTLSGSDTLSENEVFGVIRTTIVSILWVLFAFWILHRIRKFDFHV